jgi:hypothetical protein
MRRIAGLSLGALVSYSPSRGRRNRVSKVHVLVAFVMAIATPAWSWRDGSGWLAWTMFSKSQTYRLSVNVSDDSGVVHVLNPSELARFTSGDVAVYLSGAERFRHAPVGSAFRRNLPALAALACRCSPHAARAAVRLEFRRTLDAPLETAANEVSCTVRRGGEPKEGS